MAHVFPRALLRVAAKGGEKEARAVAAEAVALGVAPARLAVSATEPVGSYATFEVLAPP